jgi:hypothetical protein
LSPLENVSYIIGRVFTPFMGRVSELLVPGHFTNRNNRTRIGEVYDAVLEASSWVGGICGVVYGAYVWLEQGMSLKTGLTFGLGPGAYGVARIGGQLVEDLIEDTIGAVDRWRARHKKPLSEFEIAKARVDEKRKEGTYVRIDDAIANRDSYAPHDNNQGA